MTTNHSHTNHMKLLNCKSGACGLLLHRFAGWLVLPLVLLGLAATVLAQGDPRQTIQDGPWYGCVGNGNAWGTDGTHPTNGNISVIHGVYLPSNVAGNWNCVAGDDGLPYPDGIKLMNFIMQPGGSVNGGLTFTETFWFRGPQSTWTGGRITDVQDLQHFGTLAITGAFILETDMKNHNIINISADVDSGASTGAGPSTPVLSNLSADGQVNPSFARINFLNDANMTPQGFGTIENRGLIQKLGGNGETTIGWKLENHYAPDSTINRGGELRCEQGHLSFTGGGDTEGANFVVADGSSISFSAPNHLLFYLGSETGDPFFYTGSRIDDGDPETDPGRVRFNSHLRGEQFGGPGNFDITMEPRAVFDFPQGMLHLEGADIRHGPVENRGFLHVAGPDNTLLWGFRNAHTIIVEPGASFGNVRGSNVPDTFHNLPGALIDVKRGGRIARPSGIGGDQFILNDGTIQAEGEPGAYLLYNGIHNRGTVRLRNGNFELSRSPSLTNAGGFDRILASGRWFLDNAVMVFPTIQIVENATEVSLIGFGTRLANFDHLALNSGSLSLLDGHKFVRRTGDFTNTGTLEFGIDAEHHASITSFNTVTAGGTLKVTFGAGVEPGVWRIVNACTVAGTFDQTQFVNLPAGLSATVQYSSGGIDVVLGGGGEPDDLIAYWDFEDGDTPDLVQSVVGGIIATNQGASYTANGKNGAGMAFGGVGSLEVADASFADVCATRDEITVAFWQKSAGAVRSSAFEFYSCSVDSFSGHRGMHAHVPWEDGIVYWDTMGWRTPTESRLSGDTGTNWDDGQWHHWAFVKDGGAKSVYLDGVRVLHQPSGALPLAGSFPELRIGATWNEGFTTPSTMDDFAVYGGALDLCWIQRLADGEATPMDVLLVKETPSIAWTDPAPVTYGTGLPAGALNATANTAGTFDYSHAADEVLGAGEHTLTVDFTPEDQCQYATTQATVVLTVNKAPLTITAIDATRPEGQANPAFTFSYSGFVDGDTMIVNPPTLSTTATTASAPGTYPITVNGGSDTNYSVTGVNGTLTVTPKLTPEITWSDPVAISYGTPLGATQLNATVNIAGSFAYDIAEGTVLDAGTHMLTVMFTPTNTAEYRNSEKTVTIVVEKSALTITADDKTKFQGAANPKLTLSYAGFVNGDTAIATAPTVSTTATAASDPGIYPITVSGGSDPNYDISLVNGTLTIEEGNVGLTYEKWQAEEFTEEELADPNIGGPDADPDGDGIKNLLEFAFVGNPKKRDRRRDLLPRIVRGPERRQLRFRFRQRTNCELLDCIVQVADRVSDWVDMNLEEVSREEIEPGVEEVLLDIPRGRDRTRFFRLFLQLRFP